MKRRRSKFSLIDKYVPIEVWEQVMWRLPSKTLCRLRCVNREWRSIIDNPSFVLKHYEVYKNHPKKSFLFCEEQIDIRGYKLFFLRHDKSLKKYYEIMKSNHNILYWSSNFFVANCRGLVLIREFNNGLKLWNPSIRKALSIEQCSLNYTKRNYYVLGYAKSSNDFKVICFNWSGFKKRENVFSFGVYSICESIWVEKTSSIVYPEIGDDFSRPSHYTVAFYSEGWCYWTTRTHIIAFDFDNECFSIMDWPDIEDGMVKFLVKSEERLGAFGISHATTRMWVLDEDTRIWHVQFSINLDNLVTDFFKEEELRSRMTLYYPKSGELVMYKNSRLIRYNIKTSQMVADLTSASIHYVDHHVETIMFGTGLEGQNLVHFPASTEDG
ncbi:hypothetical protein RND81_13G127300 [Saponaria officinalis]|uniref:F-box domain-containing protein n=1 Tax=Saponaria officinalis TaxID=3572 RepID=A0AAW1H036_SAPOF